MDIHENIENLRKIIATADDNSVVGDEFARLINHPSLTWSDLIGCLRFKLLIDEYASFKLHEFLSIPIPSEGPTREQNEWYKTLKDKRIEPSDFVHQINSR